jgi:H(+)-transporting ATP synthase subunit D
MHLASHACALQQSVYVCIAVHFPANFPAGLGKGGQQIQGCRKAYLSAIQLLVQLANLQTAFMTLDVALKVTNRRVNALENVVKPKIENTIAYIKVGSSRKRYS